MASDPGYPIDTSPSHSNGTMHLINNNNNIMNDINNLINTHPIPMAVTLSLIFLEAIHTISSTLFPSLSTSIRYQTVIFLIVIFWSSSFLQSSSQSSSTTPLQKTHISTSPIPHEKSSLHPLPPEELDDRLFVESIIRFWNSLNLMCGIVELSETGEPEDIRHLYDNLALVEFFGLNRHAVGGWSGEDFDTNKEYIHRWYNYYRLAEVDPLRCKTFEYEHLSVKTKRNHVLEATVMYLGVMYNPFRQCDVKRFSFVVNDITDRKLVLNTLENSQNRMNQALESDGIWDWDVATDKVWWSRGWYEMLGYSHGELDGTKETFYGLVHPDDVGRASAPIDALFDVSRDSLTDTFEFEMRMLMKTGGYKWVLSRGRAVMRDSSTKLPLRVIGFHTDISKVKEAIRIKDEFVGTVSHELRTPLNGIYGMTQLLAQSQNSNKLDKEQRELINTIYECSENLLFIVNDLLDFSKLEAGKFSLRLRPMHVMKMIDNALTPMKRSAMEKGISFNMDISDDTPELIIADSGRLRQVLTNLCHNAIKFTDTGGVVIKVGVYESELEDEKVDGNITLLFQVIDTGIGIPSELQSRLFQSFSQIHTGSSRKYGGTGLGLVISQRLVDMMGGKIWVEETAVNKGSKFAFTVKAEVYNSSSSSDEKFGHDGSSLEEDVEDNVSVSSSGMEIPKLISSPVRRVVDNSSSRNVTPVPVSVARSVSTSPEPKGEDGEEEKDQVKLNILVVEDNLINQKLIVKFLKKLGYTNVELANNGQAGLEAYRRKRYDLIAMDISMPLMDGMECTQLIRKEFPKEEQPFICALTANAMESDREKYLSCGMDEYIAKPVKISVLEEMLKRVEALVVMKKRVVE